MGTAQQSLILSLTSLRESTYPVSSSIVSIVPDSK